MKALIAIFLIVASSVTTSAVTVKDRAAAYENGVIPIDAVNRLAAINSFLATSKVQPESGHLWVFHLVESATEGTYDAFLLSGFDLSQPGRVQKSVGPDILRLAGDLHVKSVARNKSEVFGRLEIKEHGRIKLSALFEGSVFRNTMHLLGNGYIVVEGRKHLETGYVAVLF